MGAPVDFVHWAAPFGDDWAGIWAECPRADWLLDLAVRTNIDRAALVRAACACARLSLGFLDAELHDAASACLAQAELWAARRGPTAPLRATVEALAALEDRCPDDAARAALRSAVAAGAVSTQPERATEVGALTIEAARFMAGPCGQDAAVAYTEQKSADAVRKHIPRQLIRRGDSL